MPKKKTRLARRKRKKLQRIAVLTVLAAALVICSVFAVAGIARSFGSTKKTASNASSQQASSVQSEQPANDPESLMQLKNTIREDLLSRELEDLEAQINAYLDEHNIDRSKISWAIQDLTTNATIESDNAKQNFTAASTYKLPLAAYYYEQIAQGKINPNDSLEYTAEMEEKEDAENLNQPIHLKYAIGDKIQIDELLEAVLLYSDNIAGHMLFENLGGYSEFKHLVDSYSDQKQASDFYVDEKNYLNADYTMKLLNHIYNTPGTFNDLKYWLQQAAPQTFLNRDLYGAYIQKVGNFNEVRNALGIYNGSAPFSISIFSCISKEEGQNILADLGRMVLSYFNEKYASGYYSQTDQAKIQMLNAQMSMPLDVVNLRPGPKGQTVRELTSEEKSLAEEALRND